MFICKCFILPALWSSITFAHPTNDRNLPRQERPAGVSLNSLPGSSFTQNDGIDAAVAAAPVWLFGRLRGDAGCYPESGIELATGSQNPGTNNPPGDDPGKWCTDPGPYSGPLSPGIPFPNYISTHYCPRDETWRVRYDLYYVHDGAGGPVDGPAGHRHDWEGAIVMWKKDFADQDWWHRDALFLDYHGKTRAKGWGDIQTINNDGDLPATDGKYRSHPKVYIGYWKHAAFFEKKTSIQVSVGNEDEYRSDDWYFMPTRAEVQPVSVIDSSWGYGKATNPRTWDDDKICGL